MRGCKSKKVHSLSEQVKEKRLRDVRENLVDTLLVVWKILCYQMRKCSQSEVSNSQNYRIISLTTCSNKEMLRYIPRLQKPLSVMVWPGKSASGRTHRVFVPSGVKSTLLPTVS